MGTNIVKVFRKEVDPLDLMFGQDDILNHVYEQVFRLCDLPALQKAYFSIVRKITHTSRSWKSGLVLEAQLQQFWRV